MSPRAGDGKSTRHRRAAALKGWDQHLLRTLSQGREAQQGTPTKVTQEESCPSCGRGLLDPPTPQGLPAAHLRPCVLKVMGTRL